jgi:hypothetical protein
MKNVINMNTEMKCLNCNFWTRNFSGTPYGKCSEIYKENKYGTLFHIWITPIKPDIAIGEISTKENFFCAYFKDKNIKN